MVILKENNDAILIASLIKQIKNDDDDKYQDIHLSLYNDKLKSLKKDDSLLSLKVINNDNIIRTHRKGF